MKNVYAHVSLLRDPWSWDRLVVQKSR